MSPQTNGPDADDGPLIPASPAPPLDQLDRIAPEVLRRGLPARLVGAVDELLAIDLSGHPWSELLVGAACHDAHRGDGRAEELVDRAWAAFEETEDREAMGVAAYVRANLALGRGDISRAVAWWRRAEDLLGLSTDIAIGAAAHGSLECYAKGDLVGAEHRAREALLLADASTHPADALTPLVYLAMYAYCLGDIAQADQLLRAADATCAAIGPGLHNQRALVRGFQGVIESVRGRSTESDRRFEEGLVWAEEDRAPWYGTMVRALRGAYTASWAPHRSLTDAHRARTDALETGDAWWAAMARYAEGIALGELDRLDLASEVLELAVLELTNPVERGFAQLELGGVLLRRSDRPGARRVLDEARQAFDGAGARYWATRASLALQSADRDRTGRWLRLARDTAVADPAYDRLFAPAQDLRVTVLGEPQVTLDDRPVEFLTRHAELATYLLTLAGEDGLSSDELAAALWPGVDSRRAGPRLRTLLWQVRNALGPEAWRVQRRQSLVWLDLTGVGVDLRDAWVAEEEREAAGELVPTGLAGASQEAGRSSHLTLLAGWDVALPESLRARLGRRS